MDLQKGEKPNGARAVALAVLLRCEKQGAWLDGALKSEIRSNALSSRDAALCSKICYGVCQNRMLLTFWLAAFFQSEAGKTGTGRSHRHSDGHVPDQDARQDPGAGGSQ